MSAAADLYRAGKLDEAIAAQLQEVKANPADPDKRVFLFELVLFSGDLDRAKRQVEAIRYEAVERDSMVARYRQLLDAETARRRLFRDGIMPQFLVAPPERLFTRLQAVQALRTGKPDEAARLLAEVEAAEKPIVGLLDGQPVTGLRDGDDLFGPTLEVMAYGDYYWLPLEQVDTIACTAPKFPRDLFFFPARISVKDGPTGEVVLPALYPFSHEQADPELRLGRATDWTGGEGAPVRGLGMRTFYADGREVPLLDWRELQIVG